MLTARVDSLASVVETLHTDFDKQMKQIHGLTVEQRETQSRHLETQLGWVSSLSSIVSVASERGSEIGDTSSLRDWRLDNWDWDGGSNLDTDSLYQTPHPRPGSKSSDGAASYPETMRSTNASPRGGYEGEGEHFSKMIPAHIERMFEKGVDNIKREQYVKALMYLERAVSKSEESQGSITMRYKIFEALAVVRWNLRQWSDLDGILNKMEEIVESQESRYQIWHDRAELYLVIGGSENLGLAEALCRRTLNEKLSSPHASGKPKVPCEPLHLLSRILQSKGDYLEAEGWELFSRSELGTIWTRNLANW